MWFDNTEISLALGISLAFPFLGGSLNDYFIPRIAENNEPYICFIVGAPND